MHFLPGVLFHSYSPTTHPPTNSLDLLHAGRFQSQAEGRVRHSLACRRPTHILPRTCRSKSPSLSKRCDWFTRPINFDSVSIGWRTSSCSRRNSRAVSISDRRSQRVVNIREHRPFFLSRFYYLFLSKINKHQGKRNKIECNHDEG